MQRNARLYLAAEGASAVATGGFGAVYNLYVRALGYDASFLGTLLTAAMVGAGLGALMGGWLVDRFGARGVLMGSSLLTASGVVAQLVRTDGVSLLVGSVVAGLGASAYYVAAAPFLARNTGGVPPEDMFSLDTAVVLACTALGTAVAGQAATSLLGAGSGEMSAYLAVLWGAGGIGAVSFVALLGTRDVGERAPVEIDAREDSRDVQPELPRDAPSAGGWRAALSNPEAVKLAVAAGLIGAGAGLFAPYLNVFFVEELRATPAVFGWLSAAAMTTRLVATLAGPSLAQRIGTPRAIGWTQLASVPLLLLVGFGPGLGVVGAAFLARGALMNMAAPLHLSFRMGMLPVALHGSGNALIWVTDAAMRAASTWLGGVLIVTVGYRIPYLGTAACYVASAGLFLWWFARRR